jgi:CopA family copper-resistance protein
LLRSLAGGTLALSPMKTKNTGAPTTAVAQSSRRQVLRGTGTLGMLAGMEALLPGYARAQSAAPTYTEQRSPKGNQPALHHLEIAETRIEIAGRRTTANTINGTVPGPLLRLRQGQDTVLRVTNRMKEDTSIHWHGILLPVEMDGVPGITFPGIKPGTTFEYRFQLKQYGTYWYHSHSGLQEQLGHYGPLIVEPSEGTPYRFDREHVVVLSDWTFENPYRVLARLKKQPDYYNFQRRTVRDLFADIADKGFMPTIRDRWMWADMRMNPTDILDVNGATYTYLMNGRAPGSNWTGLFRRGERVLLHFINSSANTFFDVRIPGLAMTVVEASGQNVKPVETDELRIAVAETYNVIVQPADDRPYSVFAESMDRSGYASGTLAPRLGMTGPVPPRRKRPVLTMADMGMDHGSGEKNTDHESMGHGSAKEASATASGSQGHEGHDMGAAAPPARATATGGDVARYAVAGAVRTEGLRAPGTLPGMVQHDRNTHGPGNAAIPMMVRSRLSEPGIGLGEDGWRVLVYTDLRALEKRADFKAPERELELHLTGNMERFMWSINGVPFSESKPIPFTHGERLRLTMVNDTMMNHPMHLHGMWMELENGHGEMIPRVHTVNVKPAERVSLLITADAVGPWAFHCHMLYHMEVGMFRIVQVSHPPHHQASKEHEHGG